MEDVDPVGRRTEILGDGRPGEEESGRALADCKPIEPRAQKRNADPELGVYNA